MRLTFIALILFFVLTIASAQQITTAPIPPHPFMAIGETNNIHNDGYMSDTYTYSGLQGVKPQVDLVELGGICATITQNSNGHIITTCQSLNTSTLYVLDADSLQILDSDPLPFRTISITSLEFPAGSYFYLDENERIVLPVVGNAVRFYTVSNTGQLTLDDSIEVSEFLAPDDETNSILPDWNGLLWFTTLGGTIGTIDAETDTIETLQLQGENIDNSFAVDETGGVFIVSDRALYRFDATENNQPSITWREPYNRGIAQKIGQVSQGSGTTPTVMGADYVVITDNAEPQMNVLVYRRIEAIDEERLVCTVPVFPEGESATENSVIATDTSIIVENNYGYSAQALFGRLSTRGMTRIDIMPDGTCDIIWNSDERISNAVSKMSVVDGRIYTYTRDDENRQWQFTVIDFATGATLWEVPTGTGINYNSNYAGVYLMPNGDAFVGVTAGLLRIREGE